jgi:hypothetical protein
MSLIVQDYGDKAIVVFGDTRVIKDELKEMGGKYNPKLGEEQKPGWVFSKTKKDVVNEFIKQDINSGKIKKDSYESKPRATVTDPYKKPTTSSDITVPKELLSNLISRVEILETELANIKIIVLSNHTSNSNSNNKVETKLQKINSEWADSDSDEEENRGSLLKSFRSTKK